MPTYLKNKGIHIFRVQYTYVYKWNDNKAVFWGNGPL